MLICLGVPQSLVATECLFVCLFIHVSVCLCICMYVCFYLFMDRMSGILFLMFRCSDFRFILLFPQFMYTCLHQYMVQFWN